VVSTIAGSGLKSPQQAVADAAPPSASPVTTAVERRVLVEPVVLRGQVKPGAVIKLLPPTGTTGPDNVITSVRVRQGQILREGQVVAVRSGQPMITIAFPFPLYRDITSGMTGPDVTETQRALRRLGYAVPVDGRFAKATQEALRKMFHARGFEAPAGSQSAVAALPSARTALRTAQQAYDEAVASGTGVDAARVGLDQARVALERTELEAGPALPRATVLRLDKGGRTITRVIARVGTILAADQPLVELDGEAPFVTAEVNTEQVRLIRAGQGARILDEQSGTTADAVVESVDSVPGDAGTGEGSGPRVRLTFRGPPLPVIAERSVRIDLAAPASNPVLAVPVTAVYARPDGTTFVTVLRSTGATTDVTIDVGQIAGGWVEIVPASPETLPPGTLVILGEAANGVPQ
jgi:peptidoglycan hydrolase-like protein with peptidoglycan-binding domain